MVENRCYDADCEDEKCHNPQHYNYICFDPDCEEVHCTDSNHYDKQLLRDYQENSDLSIYDHREEIDYDEDVDINICGCPVMHISTHSDWTSNFLHIGFFCQDFFSLQMEKNKPRHLALNNIKICLTILKIQAALNTALKGRPSIR